MYRKSIFIFHRSLRLNDNIGLIEALKASQIVIPVFIFTPEQITDKNKYKSNNAVKFMVDALLDLNSSLNKYGSRLFFFYGDQLEIINKLAKADKEIDAVYINQDYTAYAVKRENSIKKCDLDVHIYEDYLLHEVNTIKNGSGEYYQKFTPFYNASKKFKVKDIVKNLKNNYIKKSKKYPGEVLNIKKYVTEDNPIFTAKRSIALSILKNIGKFNNYKKTRDMLKQSTTHLSAYIKFGLVSIREVYHAIYKKLGKSHDLIKQLYWREFYYNAAFNRLDIFKGNPIKENYKKIKWGNNKKWYKAWCEGKTGYPIVDAAMRELNQTGFMHNRGRLITSNFLIKIMLVDWRYGEKYFASKLIDYDPSVNNGNWQWSSSSGFDAQPYFRIFNPMLQSEKFDKDALYIKKWIPELEDVPANDIHNWITSFEEWPDIKYPKPILDYNIQKKLGISLYKKIY